MLPLTRHGSGIRRRAALAAGALLAFPAIQTRAQAAGGVALVIGNSKYNWEAPLPNVRRDAPAVAKRFQEIGLKTELIQDAGRDALFAAVEKFKAASSGANLAVLYYAGHGASWENDTYLVPVDADLASPEVVRTLLPVRTISLAMQGAAHRLLVFDNCRNNPADGWRQRAASNSSLITAVERAATALHGPNTLVLFSTAPGRIAVDGPAGEISPFAGAFLRQLEGPSIDLPELPAKLRRDLLIVTEGRQVVWHESTYTESFSLNSARAAGSSSPSVNLARVVELSHAYAFARDKKLPLPAGLVAIRPPAGSPHALKIGAFETMAKIMTGYSYTGSPEAILVIVLSVNNNNTAQAILSYRSYTANQSGPIWAFLPAVLLPDELRLTTAQIPLWLRWKDANGGSASSNWSNMAYSTRFTRLDG